MKRSNTMCVNGEEVEYTDNQMREFYEDFLEGQTKAYFNLKKSFRDLSRKYTELEKELKRLKNENN